MAKYLDAAETTGGEVYIDVTGPWIMIVHSAAAKVTLEAKYHNRQLINHNGKNKHCKN